MITDVNVGIAVVTFAVCAGLVIYHHIGYPVLLRALAELRARHASSAARSVGQESDRLPSIGMIVPVHNEAAVIAAKIANLATLDYPRHLLSVRLVLDGCTDDSRSIAEQEIVKLDKDINISLIDHSENRGKVAVLNEEIGACGAEIVALTDASALLERDALRKAAAHFADRNVGVVCPSYRLSRPGSDGERTYWDYQTRVKIYESLLAAPMGAHGALYFFRRMAWSPLPIDTINDDFILPMRIVERGYRAVYDHSTFATELERTTRVQEHSRRIRIGAGNMQQAVRLISLADPRRGWLSFVFLSGKGLRPMVPFFAVIAVAASIYGAAQGVVMFEVVVALELLLVATLIYAAMNSAESATGPIAWLRYLGEGYFFSLVGAVRFISDRERVSWGPSELDREGGEASASFIPLSVIISKRILDLALASAVFLVFIVLFIPIAIAIKLNSPGPILYRQTRVGQCTRDTTTVFSLLKFRTMYTDAERKTGPVWASREDPRINRVGRFLRKTRLDELPQCINVLRGEMSVIGPRPERPQFVQKLEDAIPFYSDRTYGLKPGITGLAQVNQHYDTSIDDVRQKMIYDHAYALRLTSWWTWFRTDLAIVGKTLITVVSAGGQ